MTDFITVGAAGIDPELDLENGTYPLTLVEIDDPKRIFTDRYPSRIDAVSGDEVGGTEIIVWRFVTDNDRYVEGATSKASGPRSKMYEWLTALLGREPRERESFAKSDLIGRGALGQVGHNKSGYPRVTSLLALPSRGSGKAVSAPVTPTAPAPAKAATNEDDLGF